MATYEASTWADVLSIISNASGATTIDIINDIDVNSEYPSGAPIRVVGAASITINGTVNGVRHEIKNLVFHINSTNTVFDFSSPLKLKFKDIDIKMTAENNQNNANPVYLFNRVIFENASVLIQAIGKVQFAASYNNEILSFNLSGVRIEGIAGRNGSPTLSVYNYIDDCNLYLKGVFDDLLISCRRCFIDGDLSMSTTVRFNYSSTSVIVAKINTTGNVTNGNGSNSPIDMRNIIATNVTGGFLKCNDPSNPNSPDIKSPSSLAAAGFPIVAEMVGE